MNGNTARCTCVTIMLFNQLLDMPHLWMDYLGKGKMPSNRYKRNTFFCAYGTFLGSFISAHETWDQHLTYCFYICIQWTCLQINRDMLNNMFPFFEIVHVEWIQYCIWIMNDVFFTISPYELMLVIHVWQYGRSDNSLLLDSVLFCCVHLRRDRNSSKSH